MAKARFSDPDGITVKELRSILADCPDTDDDGDDAVMLVLAGNGHLSALTEVIIDDFGSTVAVPEFHGDTMRDLDTYCEFFGLKPEDLPEVDMGDELEPLGVN